VLAGTEGDGKGANIKLVNNRGYSVVVNPVPGATVSSRSHGGVHDVIVRSLEDRDDAVYVPGGGHVTFHLDDPLPPSQVFGVGPTHLSMLADIFAPVATKMLSHVSNAKSPAKVATKLPPHMSNAKSPAKVVAAQGAWLLAATDCLLKRADDGPRSLNDLEGLAAVVRDCLNTASAAWPELAKIVRKLDVPLLVAETASKLGNALLDLSVLNNRRFLTFTFTPVRMGAQSKPRTQPASPPTQPDTDSPPVCTAGDRDNDGICDEVDTCTGGGADLEPTAITYDASVVQAGQRVHFDSGVENQGALDSGVFNIKWLVDGQEVGAYGSHAGVPAKSTVMDSNSQFTWTFDSPGTYKLTFAVDVDDHVQCEANESDNVRYKTVQVQQAAKEEPEEAAPTTEETPTTEPSETQTSAPTETATALTPEPSEAAKATTAPGTTPSASVPFYTLAPTP
jgi:CARDB